MLSNHRRAVRFSAIFLLVLLFVLPLQANPFMGNGTSSAAGQPLPVRTGSTAQTLVTKQATLRDALGNYFYSWKGSKTSAMLWGILGISFLYGVFHAMGPGHRKTVVFSLYLARGAPGWEPAGTGMLLSLLHAGAAIILLLLMRGVSGAISGKADNVTVYMEGFTYLLLICVALFLVGQAIRDLIRGTQRYAGGAMSLGTILLTGIYPCPGAILVMVLSLTLSITGLGILAVFAMSLGMSIPIIAAGYLAWFGRSGLFLALKKNETKLGRISACVELFGYSFLLLFSLYMAEPFLISLMRMVKA